MRAVALPPGTHRLSRGSACCEDGVGVVRAIVAALAAILLRHRRHHAPPQRTSLGELHALLERHGRIVPGRAPSSPSRAPMFATVLQPRSRRPAPAAPPASSDKQAGEEAVEPSALLGAERAPSSGMSGVAGGGVCMAHAVCSSHEALQRVGMSWRLAKAKNASSSGSRDWRGRPQAAARPLPGSPRFLTSLHSSRPMRALAPVPPPTTM